VYVATEYRRAAEHRQLRFGAGSAERRYNAIMCSVGRKLRSVLFGLGVLLAIALYLLSFGVAVQERWVMYYTVSPGPAIEIRDRIISGFYSPIFWYVESDLPGTQQYTAYVKWCWERRK
jgi:hypothetical protein